MQQPGAPYVPLSGVEVHEHTKSQPQVTENATSHETLRKNKSFTYIPLPTSRRQLILKKTFWETATDLVTWSISEIPGNLKSGLSVCLMSLPLSISMSIASGGSPVPGEPLFRL